MDEANICFLHAPLFHPALKTVGPIRKKPGHANFFQYAWANGKSRCARFPLVGVFNLEMARIYNYLFQQTGKAFTIIHSLDGYDEISLTNDTKVITNEGEKIMTPEQLGKRMVQPSDIHGGNTVEEAAKIFEKYLKGKEPGHRMQWCWPMQQWHCIAQEDIQAYDDAYDAAVESLESGKAMQCT